MVVFDNPLLPLHFLLKQVQLGLLLVTSLLVRLEQLDGKFLALESRVWTDLLVEVLPQKLFYFDYSLVVFLHSLQQELLVVREFVDQVSVSLVLPRLVERSVELLVHSRAAREVIAQVGLPAAEAADALNHFLAGLGVEHRILEFLGLGLLSAVLGHCLSLLRLSSLFLQKQHLVQINHLLPEVLFYDQLVKFFLLFQLRNLHHLQIAVLLQSDSGAGLEKVLHVFGGVQRNCLRVRVVVVPAEESQRVDLFLAPIFKYEVLGESVRAHPKLLLRKPSNLT